MEMEWIEKALERKQKSINIQPTNESSRKQINATCIKSLIITSFLGKTVSLLYFVHLTFDFMLGFGVEHCATTATEISN